MKKFTKLLSAFVVATVMGATVSTFAACGKDPEPEPQPQAHEHTYATAWSSDETNHWHAATCEHTGEKKDEAKHVDDDKNGKCDVCEKSVPIPVVQVTVSFNVEGGSAVASVKVDKGGKASKPADPQKTGYVFGGWYKEATCENVFDFASEVISADVTVYAKWTVAKVTVSFNAGEGVSIPNQDIDQNGKATAPADPEREGWRFAGWYTDATYATEFDFDAAIAQNTVVYAKWKKVLVGTTISTAEEFVQFRELLEITGKTYTLEADIDLAGIQLAAPTVILGAGAKFDGKGHTISNAMYANAEVKTGLVFASVKGGEVTDIKFLNCVATSSNETVGIITGFMESGTATDKATAAATKAVVSKIEFNACNINSSGNYAGLIYGRNEKTANIEMSEITAKNGTSVTCAQYGGLLGGDSVATTVLKFKDLDLDGSFTSSGNGAFVAGRTRGGEVSIENAIIKAQMSKTDGNLGLFVGNVAIDKLTLKNILIVETNFGETPVYICKKLTKPKAMDYQNVTSVGAINLTHGEVVQDSTDLVIISTTEGSKSVEFLRDTLSFDFENVWMAEGEGGLRLKAASTNVKAADAKLTQIKVSTANVKVRFKKGESFSADGLFVMGVYTGGVQLVLGTDGYTTDASGVDFNVAGKYNVTVKPVNGEGDTAADVTYEIEVVEQTGFKLYDARMAHVYLKGTDLDLANFAVKSLWSDGKEEPIALTTSGLITGYDKTRVGVQSVSVNVAGFESQTISVNVVDHLPVPVANKIYINVDKTYSGDNGAAVKGIATFKELGDAIKYLEACQSGEYLDASVEKIIYIGEGRFEEHIKTSLANLTLIGKGKDKTIITCSNVQSTINPIDDKQFGLNENATLIVLGGGFRMSGIAVRNDFDYPANYKKESGPQGTALMIQGDKSVISDCLLYGNQDTLYLKGGRVYVKNSEILGNIDFIFGEADGIGFFENCVIKAINKAAPGKQESNNGYVTAMKGDDNSKPDYGYVFKSCQFTDDGTLLDGSMSLGRPWGAKATVAMLDCSFTKAYSTVAYGATGADGKAVKPRWFDMSGNSPLNADFAEYNSTGDGAISAEVAGGRILTAEQAANYTLANVFAATNGKKTWDAAWDGAADLAALNAVAGATFVDPAMFVFNTTGTLNVNEESGALSFDLKTEQTISFGATLKAVGDDGDIWSVNDRAVSISIDDTTIVTYEMGKLKALKAGTAVITVSSVNASGTIANETITVNVTQSEKPASTTYSYTYGGENAAVWEEKCNSTGIVTSVASASSPSVTSAKYATIDTEYLSLKATGKKATFTLTGFTTGSDKASKFVDIKLYDANGTVVGTLTGTTPTSKANGAITFEVNFVVTTTEFVEIRIGTNTANKSVGITSATIVVE